MKLILREDVKDLGRAGDKINVAAGYARNFLLPKKLALTATSPSLKRLEQDLNSRKGQERRQRRDLEYLAERVASQPLVFAVQAGEAGKLFGSVTSADIEHSLAKLGIEIDKRKIELEEPIKAIGTFSVLIKLQPDLTAQLTVVVESKAAAKPDAAENPVPPVSNPQSDTSPAES